MMVSSTLCYYFQTIFSCVDYNNNCFTSFCLQVKEICIVSVHKFGLMFISICKVTLQCALVLVTFESIQETVKLYSSLNSC